MHPKPSKKNCKSKLRQFCLPESGGWKEIYNICALKKRRTSTGRKIKVHSSKRRTREPSSPWARVSTGSNWALLRAQRSAHRATEDPQDEGDRAPVGVQPLHPVWADGPIVIAAAPQRQPPAVCSTSVFFGRSVNGLWFTRDHYHSDTTNQCPDTLRCPTGPSIAVAPGSKPDCFFYILFARR